MRIAVINGSPRGRFSSTLQTVLYIQGKFPEHRFDVVDAGQRIKAFQKDFSGAAEVLEKASVVLFCYPVYTFLVPSQLECFVELMKRSGVDFSGKVCSQISTSKHFFDVTAQRYIDDNARDMGMKVVRGLSEDMDDLLSDGGRKTAVKFFQHLVFSTGKPDVKVSEAGLKDVVIIADFSGDDGKLRRMVEVFQKTLKVTSRVEAIDEYPFSGGCLGCLNCAVDGKCIYKDGFDAYLREKINISSAMVYACTIKNHSMGPLFKMFDDRQFCNGHRTVTEGIPVAYLVSGDIKAEENLRTVMMARAEVGHNYLAGIADDEASIACVCDELEYAIQNHYLLPRNFYGVGGMKIFRDLIYVMGGMMKADNRFYKKHKLFDFPQKQKALRMKMKLVGWLLSNPSVKKKIGSKMNDAMVEPYKKVMNK